MPTPRQIVAVRRAGGDAEGERNDRNERERAHHLEEYRRRVRRINRIDADAGPERLRIPQAASISAAVGFSGFPFAPATPQPHREEAAGGAPSGGLCVGCGVGGGLQIPCLLSLLRLTHLRHPAALEYRAVVPLRNDPDGVGLNDDLDEVVHRLHLAGGAGFFPLIP